MRFETTPQVEPQNFGMGELTDREVLELSLVALRPATNARLVESDESE